MFCPCPESALGSDLAIPCGLTHLGSSHAPSVVVPCAYHPLRLLSLNPASASNSIPLLLCVAPLLCECLLYLHPTIHCFTLPLHRAPPYPRVKWTKAAFPPPLSPPTRPMAFIPATPFSLFSCRSGRSRLMTSSPAPPGMAPSPTRRRVLTAPVPAADTTAATPAMTLAAVGRPPAAASSPDSNSGPNASSAVGVASAPAEVVVPITSFDEYMDMLTASAERVAVLKFFAPWCRSCRAIAPKVARLAHEFPEITFYEIDYEANKVCSGCLLGSCLPTVRRGHELWGEGGWLRNAV